MKHNRFRKLVKFSDVIFFISPLYKLMLKSSMDFYCVCNYKYVFNLFQTVNAITPPHTHTHIHTQTHTHTHTHIIQCIR